jgi:hypothetical protein
MIEAEKKLSELESKLSSRNKRVVTDSILLLRNEYPFKGAAGLLISLFNTTNDLIIKDLILNFMNDIKEPEVRFEIVKEMKKNYKPETITMLVSSCWQSGLDYSEFAVDLAEIFIRGDYLTSLECFTVIEESYANIPDSKRIEIIRLLEKNENKHSAEKNSLLQALLNVLR